MNRAIVVLATLLLVSSCGQSFARRTAGTPKPASASTKTGKSIVFVTPSPAGAAAAKPTAPAATGAFVIRIRDENGKHPAGVPVRFGGPVRKVVLSDASGAARLNAPPGAYRMRIDAGCQGALIVTRGASGTVHIVAGQSGDAEVRVSWRHRIAPSGSATSDAGGDWSVGRTVRLDYDVVDRCKDDLAPSASYPTFVFQPGPNLRMVGTPAMKADGAGRGHATVQCTRAGETQLFLADKANPPDRVDLVAGTASYSGRPRCVQR